MIDLHFLDSEKSGEVIDFIKDSIHFSILTPFFQGI